MIRIFSLVLLIVLLPHYSFTQDFANGFDALTITEGANGSKTYSLSLKILALMTGLTILPSLVLGMTAFTRIIIVMSILDKHLVLSKLHQIKFNCHFTFSYILCDGSNLQQDI